MEYLSAIKLFEGMREVYLKSAAKEKNRGNAMIAMTIKGLRGTLEKHREWLNNRDYHMLTCAVLIYSALTYKARIYRELICSVQVWWGLI